MFLPLETIFFLPHLAHLNIDIDIDIGSPQARQYQRGHQGEHLPSRRRGCLKLTQVSTWNNWGRVGCFFAFPMDSSGLRGAETKLCLIPGRSGSPHSCAPNSLARLPKPDIWNLEKSPTGRPGAQERGQVKFESWPGAHRGACHLHSPADHLHSLHSRWLVRFTLVEGVLSGDRVDERGGIGGQVEVVQLPTLCDPATTTIALLFSLWSHLVTCRRRLTRASWSSTSLWPAQVLSASLPGSLGQAGLSTYSSYTLQIQPIAGHRIDAKDMKTDNKRNSGSTLAREVRIHYKLQDNLEKLKRGTLARELRIHYKL